MNTDNKYKEDGQVNPGAYILLGAVIGAGLALLFAPATGRETRSKLFSKAGGLADKLKSRVGREFAKQMNEDPDNEFPV